MPIYVGIDFGSTNTRVASSENLQQILRIKKFITSDILSTQQNLLAESILEVCEGNLPDYIGVGIHGLINKSAKKFIRMPNYSVLNDQPFDHLLSGIYPVSKLIVDNDASCGALGEAVFGAGQEFSRVVYVTLSTGVGGSLVVNRHLDESATYEPGHHVINMSETNIIEGKIPGEFEYYCSGSTFETVYGRSAKDCNDSQVWDKYAKYLAMGLHNITQLWSPEVIVLGGGLGYNNFEKFQEKLILELKRIEFTKLPKIRKGDLGDDAGIYGAFVQLNKAFAVSQ